MSRRPPSHVTVRPMPSRFPAIEPDAVFLDRDRDGIVDTVDLQIHLRQGCGTPDVLCAVLDLCAVIGFEAAAMELPLVTAGVEEAQTVRHHLHVGLAETFRPAPTERTARRAVVSADDPEALATAIRRLAARLAARGATPRTGDAAGRHATATGAGRGAGALTD